MLSQLVFSRESHFPDTGRPECRNFRVSHEEIDRRLGQVSNTAHKGADGRVVFDYFLDSRYRSGASYRLQFVLIISKKDEALR